MVKTTASIIICIAIFPGLLLAQKTERTGKWAVSFSPGIVPLPGEPLSLQPGVEAYFSHKISLLNEISLQTNKNKDLDSTALNKKYFKYKTEIRYYITKSEKANRAYFGLQFTTAKRKFDVDRADRYYETFQDDSVYTYNKASINSPVKTGTLQVGATARIVKDFYFDLEIGYGFRVINTKYMSLVNFQKVRNGGLLNIRPLSSYRYAGKLTRSQFNFGFRFLYRL